MNIVEIQCCVAGCGHSPFPMAQSFYKRAKRTHEYWSCPAGHSQRFVEKTKEQAEIARLEHEIDRLQRFQKHLRESLDHERRSCPWVGCGFVANGDVNTRDRRPLWSHMRAAHGMPSLAAVEEEVS